MSRKRKYWSHKDFLYEMIIKRRETKTNWFPITWETDNKELYTFSKKNNLLHQFYNNKNCFINIIPLNDNNDNNDNNNDVIVFVVFEFKYYGKNENFYDGDHIHINEQIMNVYNTLEKRFVNFDKIKIEEFDSKIKLNKNTSVNRIITIKMLKCNIETIINNKGANYDEN